MTTDVRLHANRGPRALTAGDFALWNGPLTPETSDRWHRLYDQVVGTDQIHLGYDTHPREAAVLGQITAVIGREPVVLTAAIAAALLALRAGAPDADLAGLDDLRHFLRRNLGTAVFSVHW